MHARHNRHTAKAAGIIVMLAIVFGLAGCPDVFAHGDEHVEPGNIWRSWSTPAWLVSLLLLAVVLYSVGMYRVGIHRLSPAKRWQAASYFTGLAVLAAALLSPLDALAGMLSSAHMVQHMLLMVVAAPLLVLAAPLPVYLWALPRSRRRAIAGGTRSVFSLIWNWMTTPMVAWLLHGVAVWIWHVPRFYQAALRDQLVHDLEHASFFISALLFWWAVLRSLGRAAAGSGVAVLLVFTTFMHGGLLAGLMTFSPSPWYPDYIGRTEVFGFTPLEDQQLAGLVMWVPAGVTYLFAGLMILFLWLRRIEEQEPAKRPADTPTTAG